MTEEIIIAGFGGQGVILSGKLICVAAMREGKKVSHIPSYGAEVRGGTANCSIIISDEDIASPVVDHPAACVVLNTPSLIKFEQKIRPGGLLIYNKSLITVKPKRTDITVVGIEANAISAAHGSMRAANMAAVGLLLKLKPFLASVDSVKKALNEVISERNKRFNPQNCAIIEAGYAC